MDLNPILTLKMVEECLQAIWNALPPFCNPDSYAPRSLPDNWQELISDDEDTSLSDVELIQFIAQEERALYG